MRKLIDPGQSEAGWHRIQDVMLCPQKHHLRSQGHRGEATPPLVKGSLIHVGLAHLYKQKQLRDKGKDPDSYYTPHEAIAVAALQNAGESDLWQELAPLAQRLLVEYAEFWGEGSELDTHWRVLAVEKELRVHVVDKARWEHVDDVGGHLWSEAERDAAVVLKLHPSTPFSPARYLYTQRADLIVQHNSTKLVYIVDHKTTSRPVPSPMRRHAMTGQFLGYRMFGSLQYKDSFGGVLVNCIQITDTESSKKFKRPKLEQVVDSHQKLKTTIIHAERLIREYNGESSWPHALQESACWAYGGCPVREACQYGGGEDE